MTERSHDFAADEVWRRAAAAWRRSDNGGAFVAALAESGLRIAMGEKCPVIVSPGGGIHPLLRAINKAGERQDGRIRKADLDARLRGIAVPAARDLASVPDFDAGVFGIINLDRLPIPSATADFTTGVAHDEAQLGLIEPRHLTPKAALVELEGAFHSAAADRAKAIREAIEAEVVQDLERKRDEALRDRIEAEVTSWDSPGIGIPGWRDAYRAELAGLPKEHGPYIRWVDRLDAESRRVVLKTGTIVTLAPTRVWADHTSSDTIAIMIAHARTRGWSSITVTGGDDKWRQDIARSATRAGLVVTDPDLLAVADAEFSQMQTEEVVQTWQSCRAALRNASPDARAYARDALLDALERIAADPAVTERVADEGQRRRLVADLNAYEQYLAQSGPPRPG